ncbi:MAG: NosD domain-containing protein [archaeon]
MFKQVNCLVFFLIIAIGFSQEISTCINITSSGTYYLISDILDSSTTSCIIISASDVVFDGQNHSLDGIDASRSYGIYISSNLKNITIRDIRISDWERGISMSATSNLTRIMSAEVFSNVYGIFLQGDFHVVANSKIYSNTDTGIRIDGKNNQISNNLIYFNGVRELSLSGNNATVYNNSFNSTGGGNYGIYCDSCGSSNISNNTLINYRYGVYSRYCGTSTYSNNQIVGNADLYSYGIYIYHYGSKDYSNITDNRIGSVYRGIHFDSTRGGQRIENNVINSTFLDIQISPPSETWTDDFCSFQFNNNSGSGNLPIKFFNYSVNLENDVLSELILCGAYYSNITNITINSPDGNLNNGFIIMGTNFTKLININSSNNYYGVVFVGPINNLTIVNSSFNLNTYGIYDSRGLSTFRKSYIGLINNSILNNTYSISAVLYNSLLSNNLIANNSYGITLEGDGTLLINNTIQNNVKSGNYEIDCRGSNQSIDGNLIQSYKAGIHFYYTTGGEIKNNLLFGAGSSTGIVLDSSSQNALIANNNVSSFYYGIQVVIGSSNHTISSNKIYFNNYCGIEIYRTYYVNPISI